MTELADHVRRRGCSAWLWNDHVVPADAWPLVPVPHDLVVDVWVRWREWTPSVLDYLASGYDVMNSNGDLLYFVLSSDGVPALTDASPARTSPRPSVVRGSWVSQASGHGSTSPPTTRASWEPSWRSGATPRTP
ncbi:hypothetical protein [Tessaracoccus sp.]|uniref:hypothetical protein n=1 Tax=Tessaracoccus sp. TaxID=1971211 RepID=UPI0026384E05|nr:hypothetical protein [Tessaracoccus sp.]